MTKVKKNPIFGKFKLGDKVWYPELTPPFRKRIPGIIEKKKIQSVGKHRDDYITSDISPSVDFTDIDVGLMLHRKKIFPGEEERLRLGKFGVEKEYIQWKRDFQSKPTLSLEEENLLAYVKEKFRTHYGLFECNYEFRKETIESLIQKGLIRRQSSRKHEGKYYWLVPTGVPIPEDMIE